MLVQLKVKNLALVENITIELNPGLNVITGETGAGKSILIGALALVLGERADKSLIRTGETACGAEAVFQFSDTAEIDALFDELGLPPCEEGQLVIRRIVKAAGSSQNLINDHTVTLQALKRLGELLVDMHGPHEHQSLLNQDHQLNILDAFGRLWKDREAYEILYREWLDLKDRKKALTGNDEDVAEQVDMLTFRIQEIKSLDLSEAEDEEIEQEHAIAGNAQRILELSSQISQALCESEYAAFEQLAGTRKSLEELARLLPEAESWKDEIDTMATQLQEVGAGIAGAMDKMDMDPGRMEWLDQRLTAYQKMKRKYGPAISDVLKTLESAENKLQDLTTRKERLSELETQIETQEQMIGKAGKALGKKRQTAGDKLGEVITRELRALGFPHAAFSISLTSGAPRVSGLDEVEFGFAPNVGESMRPLRHIASSGEISRVMLATKAVLAAHDRIPVLVFDEIDANLGGEMGHAVGQKLHDVSSSHQIVCITHLPQVAVHGDHHYAVSKYVQDDRTFSQVEKLIDQTRIEEIARMLGGQGDSRISLSHAQEMLGRTQG